MTSDEVRKKYIEFFKSSPRNHKEITPSPLVLKDDPTTLFTSAGMQQLVPYLSGERKHPKGKRLVNSQPSFRAVDIEEVGDNRHTTFFEMLGNWSLGDYFKKEQISWIWEFLTKELNLPKEKLFITVFNGGDGVSKDTESYEIWKDLGIPDEKISFYGFDKNWWSRAGAPKEMPVGEIGGPDTEVFFEFDSIEHNPKYGEKCHPNCECGRFLEIANSVFIQYKKKDDGSLEELPQKNVDHGAGLERLVAATNDTPDIFDIDLFRGAKRELDQLDTVHSEESRKAIRIILDHVRAAVFIIDSGVLPSNKLQGYVLRRLIRRAAVYSRVVNLELDIVLTALVNQFKKAYGDSYFVEDKGIAGVISDELNKFSKTLNKGLKEFSKLVKVGPKEAFDFYQTYGFPLEVVEELLLKRGEILDRVEIEKEIEKHKELSRQGATQKFGKGNK